MKNFKTDVLVIGGGFAGWFAADRARQAHLNVIVADKGYTGKCGQSPYARDFFVCNPEWGDDPEKIADHVSIAGEYLDNRFWSRKVIDDSWKIFQELISWGFEAEKDDQGNIKRDDHIGDFPVIMLKGSGKDPHAFHETFGYKARMHLKQIGADLFDRVMIMELLKQDGRVVGAAGIKIDTGEIYIIQAKAVIMCTGGCSLKAIGYSCVAPSTGDGDRMAFEAGADLLGKEFPQPMRASVENPAILGGRSLPKGNGIVPQSAFPIVSSRMWKQDGQPFAQHTGKNSKYPFSYMDLELETASGNVPVKTMIEGTEVTVVPGGAAGMAVRKADGIWPADHECRSTVPGLFAAGDALGTMQNGALYMLCGASIAGCAVTGAIAGEAAAKECTELADTVIRSETTEAVICRINAPLERKLGYSPRWIIQQLQGLMMPYFVSLVKSEERLQAALTFVMYIKEHLLPFAKAEDAHDLRLVYEAESMALSCEIRLRSSLFRQESRGMHIREDFPYRDDENWLAWTRIQCHDGKVVLIKEPVPEEWRPSPAKPYEERYTYRYPGEEEYIRVKGGAENGD